MDLILEGASIFTGHERRPGWAVAVRDGRIAAVGPADQVRELDGRVVRFPGGMVLPGFQDAHIHPNVGGLKWTKCSLHDLPDVAAYEHAVRTYAQAHPDVEWITGGGWTQPYFPRGCPAKDLLDEWVPDRPVYLTNRDGHGAGANSRAFAIRGISASTPDPSDGRIERTADGSPQGTLHEGAMDLVEDFV